MSIRGYKKKLIEVSLPLDAINVESALRKRKAPKGYPTTLHKWWAQRPLAACRAVLFASLVDDPSARPDEFPTTQAQDAERERLFRIIEELVKWENSGNEQVLSAAHAEIVRSCGGALPPVLDPFAGGGSIPLEAQRLGLEVHASDLNPVAVLINKALIEIPPKFAGHPPVHPDAHAGRLGALPWPGATGLAEDVRRYGAWIREEAQRRIGSLYPSVTDEHGDSELQVAAWLWARTVKCPNPACGAEMPLLRTFWLSTKKGKQAWVEPIVDRENKRVDFDVRLGTGVPQEGTKDRQGGRCLICGTNADNETLRRQCKTHGIGRRLLAIVADGQRGRVYLPPSEEHVRIADSAEPIWRPDAPMPVNPRWFSPPGYGMTTFADVFTPRQLVALTTLSDLVGEARARVLTDGVAAGLPADGAGIEAGGSGAVAYADAVSTLAALAVSRAVQYCSSLTSWLPKDSALRSTFARQALPMIWDFAEGNPFGGSSAGYGPAIESVASCLEVVPGTLPSRVVQLDATSALSGGSMLVSTDPPYYDNIGYADLSDFFYIWLRRALAGVYPEIMSTLLVPKAQELVATPYRFDGNKRKAQQFFETGLGAAFARMRQAHDTRFPLTVYYAFKQSESGDGDTGAASTGWETMLEGLLAAGFSVLGTWPMRTEGDNRVLSTDTNALASSIVLVCRPRPEHAPIATRSEFVSTLRGQLPGALRLLQRGNIAPVDLAQAAIGPGMAVFSAYAKVVEADGSRMPVRAALGHINQVLDEVLAEQDSEYDPATRWALAWFEQYGFNEGAYGVADVLAKAKAIAVDALAHDGFLASGAGKVRLLRRDELSDDWDPATDKHLTVWEAAQYLVRALERDGEAGAADLLARVGAAYGDVARDLAYRLFALCEKKGWSKEAMPFNALIVEWPEIAKLAASSPSAGAAQSQMEL